MAFSIEDGSLRWVDGYEKIPAEDLLNGGSANTKVEQTEKLVRKQRYLYCVLIFFVWRLTFVYILCVPRAQTDTDCVLASVEITGQPSSSPARCVARVGPVWRF